jgi:acetaldehyde dehydrogenase/alcohol dehydrogenase
MLKQNFYVMDNKMFEAAELLGLNVEEMSEAVKMLKATQMLKAAQTELKPKIDRVRAAQEKYAKFSQSKVDKIFHAAAMAALEQSVYLAEWAVKDTKRGVAKHKEAKNRLAAEYIYNLYKGAKTCGTVEENKTFGISYVADPKGLIAAVIPTTNPTSTAIFKVLLALKTRNGMIISPHPNAKESTIGAVKIMLEAAVKAGAPKEIIDWIDKPDIVLTQALMRCSDFILATGGKAMVDSAYTSGTPAIGVGPGNTPAIIDDSIIDGLDDAAATRAIRLAVSSIIESKTFDNGLICASEQSVISLDSVYDRIKEEFTKQGCHFLNTEDAEGIREFITKDGAFLNPDIVGRSAETIAELSGVKVKEGTKILIAEVESTDLSKEPFAREKLSPVIAMYKAENFEKALSIAYELIEGGGLGHTSSIYINTATKQGKAKMEKFVSRMKTCRILENTPSTQGAIGGLRNFLTPAFTLPGGSWGRGSGDENVGIYNLMNIKQVAKNREKIMGMYLSTNYNHRFGVQKKFKVKYRTELVANPKFLEGAIKLIEKRKETILTEEETVRIQEIVALAKQAICEKGEYVETAKKILKNANQLTDSNTKKNQKPL